ncbi:MAG TPA: hypothetical protein VKA27_13000 [Sunxiuqinia sp.]|nr:hypothetical protein [Sunxiuqinia sp.]
MNAILKQVITSILLLVIFGCNNKPSEKINRLQNQLDSVQAKLNDSYKPGLGEFMGNVQAHHIKLWFAGTNENWKLAGFEIHELMELFDDVEHFANDRPETKLVPMIRASIDSVNSAVQQKNITQFKTSYSLMTNTCNQCHQATEHEFNVIKIPDNHPFSDQEFGLK